MCRVVSRWNLKKRDREKEKNGRQSDIVRFSSVSAVELMLRELPVRNKGKIVS